MEHEKGLRVLSLFDGMACGMLAMLTAGEKVEEYVSFEIDQYATKTSKHNFPIMQQNGDVFKADFTKYKGFDFLVGESLHLLEHSTDETPGDCSVWIRLGAIQPVCESFA